MKRRPTPALAASVLFELKRHRVDAIPQPGGVWSILKDVPEMSPAPAALYLGPNHSMGVIHFLGNRLLIGLVEKAWPATAGMKLFF